MLTAKGKYGLKALVHLSTLQPGETAQATDIAALNNIPKKFLDAILGDLRNAGFIHTCPAGEPDQDWQRNSNAGWSAGSDLLRQPNRVSALP
jgi:transcriptional regulator Rrf2-like protein